MHHEWIGRTLQVVALTLSLAILSAAFLALIDAYRSPMTEAGSGGLDAGFSLVPAAIATPVLAQEPQLSVSMASPVATLTTTTVRGTPQAIAAPNRVDPTEPTPQNPPRAAGSTDRAALESSTDSASATQPNPALSPQQAVARLLDTASRWPCRRFVGRGTYDPFAFGALAAISCDQPGGNVTELALFQFPDGVSLANYFEYRADRVQELLPSRLDACARGLAGVRRWEHGEIACWVAEVDSKTARIRWTDERDLTYGILDGSDRNLWRLFRWWTFNFDE